jgi:hypothetical protein
MPLRKQIGEIFNEIASIKGPNAKATRKARVELLRFHDSFTLRVLLKQALDPRLTYKLPEGNVPYRPLVVPVGENPTDLFHETRRLHYFLDPSCGGHATLKQHKREQLFIQVLEGLHHDEARILVGVKEKSLKPWNIDESLVNEAFPDLLSAPVMTGPSAGLSQ